MDPRTLQAAARVTAWRREHGLPMRVMEGWHADADEPGAAAQEQDESAAGPAPAEES